MERGRVLPDTNVCYPISLVDLVLRLDEAELHEIVWTEDLLGELARTWVAKGARSALAAEKVCGDIRAAFVGQDVPRDAYEHLIASMPGDDMDDHAHAAAAVVRAPCVILTRNLKDFRLSHGGLGRHGARAGRVPHWRRSLSGEAPERTNWPASPAGPNRLVLVTGKDRLGPGTAGSGSHSPIAPTTSRL